MWGEDPNPMFGATLPRALMLISMLAVPCMLVPKPIVKYMQHQQQAARGGHVQGARGEHSALVDEEACGGGVFEEEEEFDIGEIAIHQVIETIEYVLGTVSHTASYLRLWALSLAHQQLSVVFFRYTILMGLTASFPFNIVMTYFFFALWFGITIGILLGMDV